MAPIPGGRPTIVPLESLTELFTRRVSNVELASITAKRGRGRPRKNNQSESARPFVEFRLEWSSSETPFKLPSNRIAGPRVLCPPGDYTDHEDYDENYLAVDYGRVPTGSCWTTEPTSETFIPDTATKGISSATNRAIQ
ncbi:hypothetical protein BKA56DRAFT_610902 [Ilyonectria sp. MPI-CAGE-AT-0026]|nr:hypothetical protein BKA56DRAFT_610902 [Ilyonectria sp. MPI-CAGE-AT-0026]